jgi:para-aminobenzoate synthetase component 1
MGAPLDQPGVRRGIISMSPELLLAFDASTRQVITRPIKGTQLSCNDPRVLRQSSKDAAELTMIVDLMRNDLGRVCEIGSVQVPAPRMIETHGTVHHGVAEITGRVRADVSVGGLLRAVFPGGSVTGAPKIRAMQIIDELEPQPRGPYCGCIGFISDRGDVTLNVAIRTMLLQGEGPTDQFDQMTGELRYAAGCGIVADSDPEAEYRESLAKTAVLREALATAAQRARPVIEPALTHSGIVRP